MIEVVALILSLLALAGVAMLMKQSTDDAESLNDAFFTVRSDVLTLNKRANYHGAELSELPGLVERVADLEAGHEVLRLQLDERGGELANAELCASYAMTKVDEHEARLFEMGLHIAELDEHIEVVDQGGTLTELDARRGPSC